MKFPYAMLRDFVDTNLNAEQIGDLLTMAGFELEGIEEVDGDAVLDIKVVSNRGDGLSVFGLSREVLAKDLEAKPTALYTRAAGRLADSNLTEHFQLEPNAATVEAEECKRFAVRGVNSSRPLGNLSSPEWMQKRLAQAGMRPISLLVDLTNYVMLELGQPLHAFDRDLLSEGRVVVRHAKPGEKLTTLNGEEHELSGQMMICDAEKPVGVPGVMGGLDTEVNDATTRLLLESANFLNLNVRKTRKQLGLSTEASYRFERSVDPEGVVAATRRFTELLVESAPDVQVSNILDLYPRPPVLVPVKVRVQRASRLLGMEITLSQAEQYLSRLGMSVTVSGESELTVTPPSWRPDIVREEDLVEELGRVHGFDLIPERLPEGSTTLGGSKGTYRQADLVRESLVRSGFVQIMSHSLRDYSALDALGERVAPRNPASPEHCVLRNSLLSCLGEAARRNGSRDLHLFEVGKVFSRSGSSTSEVLHAAALSVGALWPINRKGDTVPSADFFSLKTALADAFVTLALGQALELTVPTAIDERFHPTRQASVTLSGEVVGIIGQIHPEVADKEGLLPETVLFEINLEAIFANGQPRIDQKSISRNPAVRRDLAVVVEKTLPFSVLESAIRKGAGDVLEKHWLFDVYEGTGIEPGKHSLGIGLQFRKHGANFTDEEANQVRDAIVAELVSVGATLR